MFGLILKPKEDHGISGETTRLCQQGFCTRSGFSGTLGLACLLAFCCGTTSFAGNNYSSTNRITAVWEGKSCILATTSHGMFRALRPEQKWVRLSPPVSMPILGGFAHVPTNVGYLLFVGVDGDSNKVAGIYISQDQGSSWSLLSRDHAFESAYVVKNGTIYATATRNKILMSTDTGKSWRDISSGVRVQIGGILPDPDHPNLVCLRGWGVRGYILQANDEQFEWKETRDWEWKRDQPNDERFFARHYSTTWVAYNFFATLDNYFDYDFGGRVELGAFQLKADKYSYTFKLHEPKTIRVKVVLYPSDTIVKLVDLDEGAELWASKIKTPDTKYEYHAAAHFEPTRAADAKFESGGRLRSRQDFRTHNLTSRQPYERSLDLDALFKFEQKGRYRVQLIYDSIWVADRKLEEWPGSFTGEAFEVHIE